MSGLGKRVSCPPYSARAAHSITRELGLSPLTAAILVRRGHDSPQAARHFLAARECHDPFALGNMQAACDLVLAHVERGSAIVVHGDYDVDGVCSTALVVEALRALGADPSWLLPSRFDGGYGLSAATVERLAASGAGLLITTDCGITAVTEVEAAGRAGIDVLVTDHHRPAGRLPDAPILHPALGGYPFPDLCATAVAHKLAEALGSRAGHDPALAARGLDLVAIATIADLVPMRGENRRLVREGLTALARTRRPGLSALMRVAGVAPDHVDEGSVGFRLGPRINAAGRMQRADAALELLLTGDESRAAAVADELDLLNRERRDTETRIAFAAEAACAEHADAPAYVLAGEGWHAGVIGIVASRMVERHHRPCVLISLDGEGGRGSGRSIPAYDLHAGLGACAGHLRRFGGHAMAAGLELDRAQVDPLREALVEHAAGALSAADLEPVERVDGLVGVAALGLDLAAELARLAPFGQTNPVPTLLVPAVTLGDVRPLGEDEQHARFRLEGGGARARGVAFRTQASRLGGSRSRHVAVRLEANEWNGAVEPRVVLRGLAEPRPAGACEVLGEHPFAVGFARARDRGERLGAVAGERLGAVAPASRRPLRAVEDARGAGFAGLAGHLISSGERVLVVCAELSRRRAALDELLGAIAGACVPQPQPPALCSWEGLAAEPEIAAPFEHVVALDPASGAWGEGLLAALPAQAEHAFAYLAWGPAEAGFALAVAESELDLRAPLSELYRRLRDGAPCEGARLRAALEGPAERPGSGAGCARLVRVLEELSLVAYHDDEKTGPACRLLDAPRTSLERSPQARACALQLAEARRYLKAEGAREPRVERAGAAAARESRVERAGAAAA